MRHFHNIVPDTGLFETIVIGGQLTGVTDGFDPREGRGSVAHNLADCLGIAYSDLSDYIVAGSSGRLAPNEERAIDEFMVFHRVVHQVSNLKYHMSSNIVKQDWKSCFMYTNLNEGKSVVWYVHLKV
ncbi:hypothetical protein QIJ26_gp1 [ssRNA phage Zoerhiza.1_26]|uniref:Uncharacterized protein n=2 Tax=Fiersviridae TaxID=2842319 RepID=A0A8S5L321_9VIRU|nr:hypothetical protein QIJ26_gp1 [ssRNA phage Zoerhiza.1_26]QDH90517.1 MAG: hypothetical protein H1Rhizo26FD352_000005 [Leviviridae sp.]DAD51783.1 TPA_asm: hypothetical protein [ssRNA phage Zoerhiza.1_26]